MSWDEFSDLVAGLNKDTPLVNVAAIRTESDREVLKNFSKEQHKLRNEWQRRNAKKKPESETLAFLADIETSIEAMFEGS